MENQTNLEGQKIEPKDEDKLLHIANLLSDKVKDIVDLKKEQSNTQAILSSEKAKLVMEANAIKELKNEGMRDSWIKDKMRDTDLQKKREFLDYNIAKLDAEIKGLEYKFKAYRAILEYKGKQLEFVGAVK